MLQLRAALLCFCAAVLAVSMRGENGSLLESHFSMELGVSEREGERG